MKSKNCGLIWIMLTMGCLSSLERLAAAEDSARQILQLDESDRPEACADAVLAALERPLSFALESRLKVNGKTPVGHYKVSQPDGSKSKVEFGGDESGNCRMILTQDRCYFENVASTPKKLTTFDGSRTTDYFFRSGRISSVQRNCKTPPAPVFLAQLSQVLNCTPFRLVDSQLDAKALCERIRKSEWFGTRRNDSGSELLVLRYDMAKGRNDTFIDRYVEYALGDVGGALAVIEGSNVTSHKSMNEKLGECVETSRYTWDCDYQLVSDHLIPTRFREYKQREITTLDGRPLAGPFMSRESRVELVDVKVLDAFPESILNVDIPPTAIIEDLCPSERSLAEKIETRQKRTPYWMLVAGCLFLACALGLWRYLRSNQNSL